MSGKRHPLADPKILIRENILNLKPYRCARDDYDSGILLDANENDFGPCLADRSFETSGGGSKGVNLSNLNRYPDPYQRDLKEMICRYRNSRTKSTPSSLITTSNVFLGVGSDEAIDMLIRIFCVPGLDSIVVSTPPMACTKYLQRLITWR